MEKCCESKQLISATPTARIDDATPGSGINKMSTSFFSAVIQTHPTEVYRKEGRYHSHIKGGGGGGGVRSSIISTM